MHNTILDFINNNALATISDKLLLTVSGGKDSVCMAYLFSKLDFTFAIAHCNFNLRGEESDNDQKFVRELAKELGVLFYTKSFQTQSYAKRNKLSIQMAARDLRYQWFEELRIQEKFTKIVTAHHIDDAIETLLINKKRKSSIGALTGIPLKNGFIIRPLMCLQVHQIEQYIKEKAIPFRQDKSNFSVKYLRNEIRHEWLPKMNKLDLLDEIEANKITHNKILEHLKTYQKCIVFKDTFTILPIKQLVQYNNWKEILYECLKSYGPFHWNNLFNLVNAEIGKKVINSEFRVIKEREALSLSKIPNLKREEVLIFEHTTKIHHPIFIGFSVLQRHDFSLSKNNHLSALDFNKLHFPLILRRWKEGDSFVPLGMKGRKKISDFMIDEKFTTIQKENIWVLCSLNEIVCLVGCRINDNYKLVAETEKVYLVQPLKEIL